ncbi:hypothetical protein B0H19DRAFT_1182929 [Mycena capillaripes]|nr:hypothetical protein B0H19DRAFT_1182929 [Mycena capillaripes]
MTRAPAPIPIRCVSPRPGPAAAAALPFVNAALAATIRSVATICGPSTHHLRPIRCAALQRMRQRFLIAGAAFVVSEPCTLRPLLALLHLLSLSETKNPRVLNPWNHPSRFLVESNQIAVQKKNELGAEN